MNELLTAKEAAQVLGMSEGTARRLFREGVMAGYRDAQDRICFERKEVERVKAKEYPAGMSHRDIAERYGVKRTVVIYHFKRLKVKPLGVNRGGNGRTLYDFSSVSKFANLLGWRDQLQSPKDESSNPSPATSAER